MRRAWSTSAARAPGTCSRSARTGSPPCRSSSPTSGATTSGSSNRRRKRRRRRRRRRRPGSRAASRAGAPVAEPYVTEVDIDAPVEEVFRHLVDPVAMIAWMGQHATLEPSPGGAFQVDINGVPVRGEYRIVDPPHRVLVTWGVAGSTDLAPGSTEVEFTLRPTATGTRLRLEHRNLPDSQAPVHAVGWTHFLDRLGRAASGRSPQPDPWDDPAN